MSARPITPRPAPYRLQKHFTRTDAYGEIDTYIIDPAAITALQSGINVARRIFFSDRVLDIVSRILSAEVSPANSKDNVPPTIDLSSIVVKPQVLAHLSTLKSSGNLTIVVDYATSSDGYVDPVAPTHIRIRGAVVDAAVCAHTSTVPYVKDMILFQISVILLHEMIHSARLTCLNIQHDTPPSVSDGSRYRKGKKSGLDIIHGEGGWAFEAEVFGGSIHAAVYSAEDERGTFPDQPRYIFLQRLLPYQDWMMVPVEVVQDVLYAHPDWETSLPFTQMTYPTFQGTNTVKKLRHSIVPLDQICASPSVSPSPAPVTPPFSPATRTVPSTITCGYRGDAAPDEEVSIIQLGSDRQIELEWKI
ncbi:hypothetical protein IAT40_000370 [Kwoniella sp. CBS 6097]